MLMRGGTSKGAFFLGDDLPAERSTRDALLLALMGTPDPRQIDGIGGATPLTSKVAIVDRSRRRDADVDYLFLQIGVDDAVVSDRQTCGNLLAAVGQFAVERRLVAVSGDHASVRIYLRNTDSVVTSTFPVQDGRPVYSGSTAIDGVPGTAARVDLDIDVAADADGSRRGVLPTGNVVDVIDDVEVTLVDGGMPVVVMRAVDVGARGTESPRELEANAELRARLESIRRQAGPLMGLGDVSETTVPKMTMVSPPSAGAGLSTRTFIPHRCHEAIGVFGAVSVAAAAGLAGSPAASVLVASTDSDVIVVEHPTGALTTRVDVDTAAAVPTVRRAGVVRTARLLMDGVVFPRSS